MIANTFGCTFTFFANTRSNAKNTKELKRQSKTPQKMHNRAMTDRTPSPNSTYPNGRGSCSKASFAVNQTLVFQITFCGKTPAFLLAEKHCK
jgi:hypothetical protein